MNVKIVCQYDLDGNFLKRFNSVQEAANEVRTKPQNIFRAMNGKSRTAKRFVWRDFQKKIIEVDLYRNAKTVYQYDLEGNYIREYSGVSEAAKDVGIRIQPIYNAIDGKRAKYSAGYIWRSFKKEKIKVDLSDKNRGKEIHQYDLEGNYIRSFISITEAGKILGTTSGNLTCAIDGKKSKTAKRFYWRTVKKKRIKVIGDGLPKNNIPVIIKRGNKEKKYDSILEASREENFSSFRMKRILIGEIKDSSISVSYARKK
jgi:NUMOD1 domain